MCRLAHSHVWHDSSICVTWLIHTCNWRIRICSMTRPCVRAAWLIIRATWLFHMRATWLIHMCDMTDYTCDMTLSCMILSYVQRDSLVHVQHDSWICATWLIHTIGWRRCRGLRSEVCVCVCVCDMTCLYAWHDSFMRATWDLSRCVTWLIHAISGRRFRGCRLEVCLHTWLNHICDMTSSYVQHDSFASATWLMHTCDTTHS